MTEFVNQNQEESHRDVHSFEKISIKKRAFGDYLNPYHYQLATKLGVEKRSVDQITFMLYFEKN